MAIDARALWNMYRLELALVLAAYLVFRFSRYHGAILFFLAPFVPVWLAAGTSTSPDILDVAFLVAVNMALMWANFFKGVFEHVARAESFEDGLLLGIQIIFSVIMGYAVAFILSFILFIPATIFVLFFNTPVQITRITLMVGACMVIGRAFKFRSGINRLGLSFGASMFFVLHHGFFSSNIYYTWDKVGQVWRGEILSFNYRDFLVTSN